MEDIHVQFRTSGDAYLADEIDARSGALESAGLIARRDLTRYYRLLKWEREGIALSGHDARALYSTIEHLLGDDEIVNGNLAVAIVSRAARLVGLNGLADAIDARTTLGMAILDLIEQTNGLVRRGEGVDDALRIVGLAYGDSTAI